jgi:VIT1/CCC1 family predicted Fe2+/Mn2+ transporter
MNIDKKTRETIIAFQRNEITEHHIYKRLAEISGGKNGEVLKSISGDELRHYGIWKKYSGIDVRLYRFKFLRYILIARVFGLTFAVKLMEGGEKGAQKAYDNISAEVPEAKAVEKEESGHEKELIKMIDEEKLKYIGSIVLGLNDALVELTGTLAGLTFALQNTKLIGVAGLITGIAASLSMAASEYLSTKTEGEAKDPIKASIYTGITYTGAVIVLVLPYLLLAHYLTALACTLIGAVVMIYLFTFYYSVVKDISFRARFLEMVSISLGVAGLSFVIGLLVRQFLGINI